MASPAPPHYCSDLNYSGRPSLNVTREYWSWEWCTVIFSVDAHVPVLFYKYFVFTCHASQGLVSLLQLNRTSQASPTTSSATIEDGWVRWTSFYLLYWLYEPCTTPTTYTSPERIKKKKKIKRVITIMLDYDGHIKQKYLMLHAHSTAYHSSTCYRKNRGAGVETVKNMRVSTGCFTIKFLSQHWARLPCIFNNWLVSSFSRPHLQKWKTDRRSDLCKRLRRQS